MIEVLRFVFSSFWVWLGCVILVATFGTAIAGVILAARGKEPKP